MKFTVAFSLFFVISCTKSETQYKDNENSRQSVNDRKSDTIKVIPEISDTLTQQPFDHKSEIRQ
jgi:large-conductance mechanosensitive channel